LIVWIQEFPIDLLLAFYIAHFNVWARLAGLPTSRLDMLLAFGLFWSTRLSFNYWRKGGYQKGSEDYRWEILREKIPGPLFFVFNVTFISLAQSVSETWEDTQHLQTTH